MRQHSLLICLAGASIGLVIGYLAVRALGSGGSGGSASFELVETTRVQSASADRAVPSAVDAEAPPPMQVISALAEKSRGIERDHTFYTALQRMTAAELSASAKEMFEFLKKIGRHYHEAFAMDSAAMGLAEAWMDRWLELDAAAAVHFLNDPDTTEALRKSGALQGVVSALARREPQRAQEYVLSLETGKAREVSVAALLRETAKLPDADGRKLLEIFSTGADRASAIRGYIEGKAEVDPRAALDLAIAEAPGPLRKSLLDVIARRAGAGGVASVTAMLDRIEDPELRRGLAARALYQIGWDTQEDPLPWIIEESQRAEIGSKWGRDYDEWTSAIGQTMARRNPTAALEWAWSLDSDFGKGVLTAISGHASNTNPEALCDWLKDRAGALQPQMVEQFDSAIVSVAERDLNHFKKWCESLPAGLLQDRARLQIALNAAGYGDTRAAESAYQMLAGSDTEGALAKQVAQALAKQNAAAAAEWALRQPDGPARAAAIRTVAEEWSATNPAGAAQWIETIPPGAERDLVLEEYASKVAYADPLVAVEWVASISTLESRKKAAEEVFGVWSMENPVAAREWLKGLPDLDEAWKLARIRNAR